MILESIELKNIRSYDEQKIEFPRGITLFEGDIGSGKSTILMAIEFAFFGTGSQKGDSMLSKKAKNGSVKLRFEVDGEKYEVYRELKRTTKAVNQHPTHCYLKIGEVENPFSPSELKQEVLKILKFNEPASPNAQSKIYRYAVFTPQEEMKQILYDSDKRQETIRRAFGVEDYKNARQNAVKVSRVIEIKSKIYQDRSKNIVDLKNTLNTYTVSKKLNEESKIENNEKKEKIEGVIDEIKEEIDEIEKNSSKKIESVNKKQTCEEVLKNLRINELRDEIKELQYEIDRREKEIVSVENEKRPTEITKETIEKKIDEIKKIESNRSTLLHNKSAYSQGISELKKLGTKCLFCHQNITKEHSEKLVEEQNNALTKINSSLQDIDEKIKDILNDVKIGSVENAVEELSELKRNLEKYEESIERIQTEKEIQKDDKVKLEAKEKKKTQIVNDIEETKLSNEKIKDILNDVKIGSVENAVEELSELKRNLEKYEESIERIQTEKEIQKDDKVKLEAKEKKENELEKKESELKTDIMKLEREINEFPDYEREKKEKEDERSEMEDKLDEIIGTLGEIKQKDKSLQEKIDDFEQQMKESIQWGKKHKKLEDYQTWISKFFIPTTDEIERQVLNSIRHDFNETYRNWFKILIDDSSKDSQLDEDFTPILEQDGEWQDFNYVSGGEKTSIALAYRLSLNNMMRRNSESLKSNLLILDEPTDGFSKNHLSKVRDVLKELGSEQIILVSHEKELEGYVDNIFQISKEKGYSKVEQID